MEKSLNLIFPSSRVLAAVPSSSYFLEGQRMKKKREIAKQTNWKGSSLECLTLSSSDAERVRTGSRKIKWLFFLEQCDITEIVSNFSVSFFQSRWKAKFLEEVKGKKTSKAKKSNHHFIGSSCLCLIQIQFAKRRW